MKTKMRATSIDAYYSIDDLPTRRRAVFNALKTLTTACNLDVADYLNWSINRVTPRMNELVNDEKLVEEAYRGFCKQTGRRVIFWKIKEIKNEEGNHE